jgi:hypothetical protein
MARGELVPFPIAPEVARRLADRDGPDSPVGRKPGFRDCWHEKVELNIAARHIRCLACEEIIDPIAWIDNLAREWDSYLYRWRDARLKIEAIEKRLAEAERKERNLKARLRNAEHPRVKEARQLLGEAEKVMWRAQEKLGFDPTLQKELLGVWQRCRRVAEQLRPSRVAPD